MIAPSSGERRDFIETLAQQARAWVGDSGTVVVTAEDDACALGVVPSSPSAAPIWVVATDWIDVQVGQSNSRWEFDYSDESASSVRDILRAVIDGGVTEFRALGRSQVRVALPDRNVNSGVGHQSLLSLLPAPGWRWWGVRQTFAPYKPQPRSV